MRRRWRRSGRVGAAGVVAAVFEADPLAFADLAADADAEGRRRRLRGGAKSHQPCVPSRTKETVNYFVPHLITLLLLALVRGRLLVFVFVFVFAALPASRGWWILLLLRLVSTWPRDAALSAALSDSSRTRALGRWAIGCHRTHAVRLAG
ncbi:hypothetical protein F5B20DRAFT_477047 [Whalleya microplaca]|nr:hypothetical protein F5B20DRAFT_477047 [Whalleya microplaca]